MSRDSFTPIDSIPVLELMLDTSNPRIRHGADQTDCLARVLRDETRFMNLLKDIAQNGLSPEHVLVSPGGDGKWIVRDGNRRVAALKMLNLPDCCPVDRLKPQIAQIALRHAGGFPRAITCLSSSDETSILDYLVRKHTGQNEGVGLRDWTSFMRSVFNLQHGFTENNKRAAQLVMWAEDHGTEVADGFPLTTLTRFTKRELVALLGFSFENDQLQTILPEADALRLLQRVLMDLETGAKKVDDLFTPEQQRAYVQGIRNELGPAQAAPAPPATAPTDPPTSSPPWGPGLTPEAAGNSAASPASATPQPTPASTPRRPPSPTTPSWERPCLFVRKHPGFGIPSGHTKVANVISELKVLKVKETPQAVAMLLRTLIELSETHYRETHGVALADNFHQKIARAADHMRDNNRLTPDQHQVILAQSRAEHGLLHVKTLHGYVHSPAFHPNYQTLNSLWDEISCFVAACWGP